MKSSPKKDRPNDRPQAVTQMLVDGSNGNQEALAELMPLVYDELRRLADDYLRRHRRDNTLQATALVHEAYLQLVDQTQVRWQTRAQFFGIAANLMRQIIIDHARAHAAAKRGGSERPLSLDEAVVLSAEPAAGLLALDDALKSLSVADPQQARIVELRFFGGLTMEEIAEFLGISPRTVYREWRTARAWLHSEIRQGGPHEP